MANPLFVFNMCVISPFSRNTAWRKDQYTTVQSSLLDLHNLACLYVSELTADRLKDYYKVISASLVSSTFGSDHYSGHIFIVTENTCKSNE